MRPRLPVLPAPLDVVLRTELHAEPASEAPPSEAKDEEERTDEGREAVEAVVPLRDDANGLEAAER